MTMNVPAMTANWPIRFLFGSMNCGRKATKKSNPFGLVAAESAPCRNSEAPDLLSAVVDSCDATGGDRHTWIPSQTRYAPPIHLSAVSHTMDDWMSAPIPNIDNAMMTVKPTEPPTIVKRVLLWPCSAPCVSASKLLGPGDSDKPTEATKKTSQVSICMLVAIRAT